MLLLHLRRVACAALLAVLAGCAADPQPFPELPRLGVAAKFGVKNLCGLGVSPAIAIANAPPGVAQYTVKMTNTDVLFQRPWQTTVPAQGASIAEGAAASYAAPCPGDFQTYHYRFEVLAMDSQSRPLAYGQTIISTDSLNRLLRKTRGGLPEAPIGPAPTPIPSPWAPPDFVFSGDRDRAPESIGPLRY